MGSKRSDWNNVRGKGFFVAVLVASVLTYVGHAIHVFVSAKIPGDTHCYRGVCHRVYTLDETRGLVGQTVDLVATHYDWPGVDKFNVGEFTSSGEVFDADNAARISASNYPDGTELLLWHPRTRIAVHVRVNDFGPFKGNRTLDVTRGAAEAMGWAKNGVATLKTTVIWAPPAQEPRYRKGRVYPPSLGPIGVVEAHQYAALVEVLVATAAARNGLEPGQGHPNVAALLASLPTPPPSFRSEGIDEADDRAEEKAAALAALVASLPPLAVEDDPPYVEPVYKYAPQFRPEAIAEAALRASEEAAAIAAMVASLPAPVVVADLPADLTAPVIVAAVVIEPPASSDMDRTGQVATAPPAAEPVHGAADASATSTPQPAPIEVAAAAVPASTIAMARVEAAPAQSAGAERAEDGTSEKNQSTVVVVPPLPVDAAPSLSVLADDNVSVASARVPVVARWWFTEPLVLLIGISLMLSTWWGATSMSRTRRARGSGDIAAPTVDPLQNARGAVEAAAAHARSTLAAAATSAPADDDERLAREDLARELALRDVEREQEAAMRARAEAAAAAHAAAQRELAALETIRLERARMAKADPVVRAPAGKTLVAPGVALRAQANDEEMARFASLTDRRLVGAIVGLPGAAGYWGNTIIAQMQLEGTAKSGSPMRVDGTVNGAVVAPVVLISEGAVVDGIVAAETVIVLGKVTGVLTGRNVIVAASAEVEGEAYYQTIAIDPSAHCDVRFRRLPNDEDPIELGSAVYAARAA